VEFIVVTSSDETLEQIGQVLDDDCTVRHVDAPFAASVLIRPARPYVVLLDARGHADLATVIESVQSPEGTSVVVVLAPAGEIATISRAVRGSATFAVLPIPIEPGQTVAVIDGAREEDINDMLTRAGLDTSGQVRLFDGRTGEAFTRQVTVGYKYILKLKSISMELETK